MRPLTIGFDQYNYGGGRNIYEAPVSGVTFKKVTRVPLDLVPIMRKTGYFPPYFFDFSYFPRPFSGVDAFHCWNRIYWGRRKWGVSFEHSLPRYPQGMSASWREKVIRQLESDSCHFIIAMSNYAKEYFLHENKSLPLKIKKKLHVVHPMQFIPSKINPHPNLNGPLKIIFVGNQVFSKGLIPLLRSMSRYRDDLELTIVSTLTRDNYVTEIADEEFNAIRGSLDRPFIKVFTNIPNDEVLKLIDESHLLVLPTLNDTFGYVVLESMSRGRPVITTDVQALCESNSLESGWFVHLGKSEKRPGMWIGMEFPYGSAERKEALAHAYQTIEEQLIQIFESILADPGLLQTKAENAFERVNINFSPELHSERLARIYEACL